MPSAAPEAARLAARLLRPMATSPKSTRSVSEPNPQIEITPEMIEAGYAILRRSGIKDEYLEADKLWIVEIFETMYRLLPPRSTH